MNSVHVRDIHSHVNINVYIRQRIVEKHRPTGLSGKYVISEWEENLRENFGSRTASTGPTFRIFSSRMFTSYFTNSTLNAYFTGTCDCVELPFM